MHESPQPATLEPPFADVPIEIKVSVGRARQRVRDLLQLTNESVLPLDRTLSDPVDLYVGERLIARGELIEPEDGKNGNLAVRVTEVVDTPRGR